MDKIDKQKAAFDSYLNGENIFMTGGGGTGKTFIIKRIYKHAKNNNRRISVTALTGVASILLDCNGTTIHSWSGIGIANKPDIQILNKIIRSKFYRENWENTDILIIDEISMMSARIFELLNQLGQRIRHNRRPFGGIQIIFSGDFFQLPPVKETIFCFESPYFMNSFDTIIYLNKIYRQTDSIYKKLLMNMRKGLITKSSIKLLNEKLSQTSDEIMNDSQITRLVPTKQKAQDINEFFINKIKEKKYIYKRTYKETYDTLSPKDKAKFDLMSETEKELEYKFIKESTLTEERLELKMGAFVMCIANIDLELKIANGSTGVVIGFTDEKYPIINFGTENTSNVVIGKREWKSENIPGISVYQLPLILAWGITIHKAQGLTLERAIVDVGKDLFEAGQMYVALSRLKSLEGLYLKDFNVENLKINRNVIKFYEALEKL